MKREETQTKNGEIYRNEHFSLATKSIFYVMEDYIEMYNDIKCARIIKRVEYQIFKKKNRA